MLQHPGRCQGPTVLWLRVAAVRQIQVEPTVDPRLALGLLLCLVAVAASQLGRQVVDVGVEVALGAPVSLPSLHPVEPGGDAWKAGLVPHCEALVVEEAGGHPLEERGEDAVDDGEGLEEEGARGGLEDPVDHLQSLLKQFPRALVLSGSAWIAEPPAPETKLRSWEVKARQKRKTQTRQRRGVSPAGEEEQPSFSPGGSAPEARTWQRRFENMPLIELVLDKASTPYCGVHRQYGNYDLHLFSSATRMLSLSVTISPELN